VAVDIADDKLELARSIGAEAAVNGAATDVAGAVMEVTNGGAHISVDALGHPDTLFNSVSSLRKQGRHIQIGIMPAGMHNSAVPMDKIIGRELVILGSHGIQAHRYPEMLELISRGKIKLRKLIGRTITLEDAPGALMSMDNFEHVGATVIDLDLAE
jgi:alcohol dehydrogenase